MAETCSQRSSGTEEDLEEARQRLLDHMEVNENGRKLNLRISSRERKFVIAATSVAFLSMSHCSIVQYKCMIHPEKRSPLQSGLTRKVVLYCDALSVLAEYFVVYCETLVRSDN